METDAPAGTGRPAEPTPAPDIVDLLMKVADSGASDLHLTVGRPPTMRLNGKLVAAGGRDLTPKDTKALLYSLMTQDQRDALERSWEFDFAYSVPGRTRFRVNAYFQRGSVGAAFRFVPSRMRSFDELGLPAVVGEMANKARGLVLVTGQAGAGKTTTLASMVDYINENQAVHIMTIEDPIEYLHQHKLSMVNQREVGTDTKTFQSALKYVLREDPDVIMVGEMRDLDTIQAALTAAETGHLVLASLHTQDAAQTIDRIVDVFPSRQQQQVRIQLAGTLQGVVCQQLLPNADETGRVLVCEVLVPTGAIRNLIREAKSHQLGSAMQTGRQFGMITMDEALADKYSSGGISYETAIAQALDPVLLRTRIKPDSRSWNG